jgi:hypothetical protein
MDKNKLNKGKKIIFSLENGNLYYTLDDNINFIIKLNGQKFNIKNVPYVKSKVNKIEGFLRSGSRS